jgi:uncharacterized membrane protein (UPF0127 family)
MSIQLKIFLYILFVLGIFYFIQTKYNIFEISLEKLNTNKEEIKEEDSEVSKLVLINEEGKDVIVDVEVVDTDILRRQGLSGRRELGDYQGMLFVMDSEGLHSFWMKDMYISLDIIYISKEGYIVEIFNNQQPCNMDFCPSIKTKIPSKYVLEVNEGFCEINRIAVGNEVIFNM